MNSRRRIPAGRLAVLGLAVFVGACSNLNTGEPTYVPARPSPAGTPSHRTGPAPSPAHREQAGRLSPAAEMLVARARTALSGGDPQRALDQLERAQRISPHAPRVYLQLARTYQAMKRYGQAQQLVLKGLSLAGDDNELRAEAWSLMADIRQSAGDAGGAAAARKRAARY